MYGGKTTFGHKKTKNKQKNPTQTSCCRKRNPLDISPEVGGGISTLSHCLPLPSAPANKLGVTPTQRGKKNQLCLAVSFNMFYLHKHCLVTNIALVVGWR